jgi:hypothetical protein
MQACAANDDGFEVTLKNNTSQSVVDHGCDDSSCHTVEAGVVLKPGQTFQDFSDPDGIIRSELIRSSSGVLLGCLPFPFSKTPTTKATAYISEMVPCGGSGGASQIGTHDWPFRQI